MNGLIGRYKMNYEPNTTDWQIGDIVIHDADEKTELYLMTVIDIDCDRFKTKYINRKGIMPFYWNRKEVLHDPARFGL